MKTSIASAMKRFRPGIAPTLMVMILLPLAGKRLSSLGLVATMTGLIVASLVVEVWGVSRKSRTSSGAILGGSAEESHSLSSESLLPAAVEPTIPPNHRLALETLYYGLKQCRDESQRHRKLATPL